MSYSDLIDKSRLPRHVAIIMDGNGRWAKSVGKDRSYGHLEGVTSVRHVIEAARTLGISYVTLYTFSTENWNRPESEVIGLMKLMLQAIERETPDMITNGIRLQIIGDLKRLPVDLQEKASWCMAETADGKGMALILALSYSSRWEIVETVKNIATDFKAEKLSLEDIDEALFAERLQTHQYPDPDFLIRTGGELRMSNFLMWQLSYSELYFTETPWPIFREEAFYEAIYSFQMRQRRFGKTSEQVQP
jgi:undecaprenyl diphosphate synthase